MEEFAEVSTEQEFQSAEAQETPLHRGEEHDAQEACDNPVSAGLSAADEVSAAEEKTEVYPKETEPTVEEAEPVEAGGEDSRDDFNGNEVPEAGLPDDIMKACVESGLPPLRVYESMMLKKQGEQIAALQQEIATLRQNAEAAQRAPVTAASLGGSEGNEAEDMFRKGFDYLVNHS